MANRKISVSPVTEMLCFLPKNRRSSVCGQFKLFGNFKSRSTLALVICCERVRDTWGRNYPITKEFKIMKILIATAFSRSYSAPL